MTVESTGFKASDVLAGNLQKVLTDVTALSLVGKQLHWNITGEGFRSLHLYLDAVVDIAREASELHNRSHASFVLDTMEFLAAGGRCPTLVAYLGGKLSCRPGILVDNQSGAMKVGKLYRGKQEKVLERYVSDTLARYTDIVKDEIFITHSGVSDEVAAAVRKLLEERGFRTIYTTTASCTISSHCGPGTLGILFMTETPSA